MAIIVEDEILVPNYGKGHACRVLVALAAIDHLNSRGERATSTSVANLTGLNNTMVDSYVRDLNNEFGTMIVKDGTEYAIQDWGVLLKPEGVRELLYKHVGHTNLDAVTLAEVRGMGDDATELERCIQELARLHSDFKSKETWLLLIQLNEKRYPGLDPHQIAQRWLSAMRTSRLLVLPSDRGHVVFEVTDPALLNRVILQLMDHFQGVAVFLAWRELIRQKSQEDDTDHYTTAMQILEDAQKGKLKAVSDNVNGLRLIYQ